MKLNVCGKFPDDESFVVRVKSETKTIDNLSPQASFEINPGEKYDVCIEQPLSKNTRTPIVILFYVLTAVIQGVFNILLMNTGSKWYKEIKAYRVKTKLSVQPENDTDIHFTYSDAEYDEAAGKFNLPVFTVDAEAETEYLKNPVDFKNQYFNYIERFCSILSVCVALFGLLLYVSVVTGSVPAIAVTSAMLFALVLTGVIVSKIEHKRLKKLHSRFLGQE